MKIVIGLVVVVVLLVGGILSLPFLVDLNKYQDQYKPLIEEALNRKIQLQDIRLRIWPRIGARVAGFTVLDDPSFSSGPFASLTSLDVGVKLLPLLSGKVEVEEITLREPVLTVITNKSKVMNVSTIGPKTPTPAAESGAPSPSHGDPLQALALLAVDHLSIDGGKVTYRDLSTTPVPAPGAEAQPGQMSGLPLQVSDLPPGTVSVRVIRRTFADNVAGQEVKLARFQGEFVWHQHDQAVALFCENSLLHHHKKHSPLHGECKPGK